MRREALEDVVKLLNGLATEYNVEMEEVVRSLYGSGNEWTDGRAAILATKKSEVLRIKKLIQDMIQKAE